MRDKGKKEKKEREDKKALDTTLRFAQKSTGSMGVHDSKSKFEPEIVKKKHVRGPDNMKHDDEKSRSINILNGIKRKRENREGVFNEDKMVRAHQTSEDKRRQMAKK